MSAPATYIGDPCDNFALAADISVEKYPPAHFPNFSWSSPLRMPILPISWRLFLLYPRPMHVTVGSQDTAANPTFIGPVMEYMQTLYRMGNQESGLLYRTDPSPHGYMQNRRQDTYAWFAHTLLDEPLAHHAELATTLLSPQALFPDLSGTVTLDEMVAELVDAEIARRAEQTSAVSPAQQVKELTTTLRSSLPLTLPVTQTLVWENRIGDLSVRGYHAATADNYYPVFVFENHGQSNHKQVLFLPTAGTYQQLDQILPLLERYQTVISIDYLGIGELKSNRLLLHTFTRYFMHHTPNVPQMNIALLNSYLQTMPTGQVDIVASSWATSFYAMMLKSLDNGRVGAVRPVGVPGNEFVYLKTGRKIPDLLLWADLFKQTSVHELTTLFPAQTTIPSQIGVTELSGAAPIRNTGVLTVETVPALAGHANGEQRGAASR